MLREITLAQEFVGMLDRSQFESDPMRLRATIRCLKVISEASRRLPDTLKKRHSHVPWSEIAGAGNIYRHDYEDVLAWNIWETVKSLPTLRSVVEQELAS